jgi:hypothetical protein
MLIALTTSQAFALEGPQFSKGGFVFNIQYGPGFWNLDKAKIGISAGIPNAELFTTEVQGGHTVSIRAAYNILGHASIGAELTGTGWNITTSDRGGAGFVIGSLTWHPLEVVFMNKDKRPIPLDVGLVFGAGYGIAGQHRGMDGLIFETALNVDFFFTRFFSLGLFGRGIFMNWNNFYLDYENRALAGNTIPIQGGGGVGNFFTLGLSLSFRAGE